METKTNNRLWQARHKAGLEEKQVAYLLGHKNVNQISRYERGVNTPSFKTALKLELILRVPVADLFPEHYQCCRAEIADRLAKLRLPETDDDQLERSADAHICTYANLPLQKKPTPGEINSARQHTINLMRRLGDVIHEKNELM